jgi:aspartate aminotransferase-like enzyme
MLFTPGPTMIEQEVRDIAAMQMPYFRDQEYTSMVSELTANAKYLFQTSNTPLTITASGSGVMEMAILNLLNAGDEVVVLSCGTFGHKWVTMCESFGIKVKELVVPWGKIPDLNEINDSLSGNIKALLITAHETSTGLLNDIAAIGKLTRDKDILLIVDAVSSIGADTFRMDEWHCDCAIVSSQKALACMPGISFIVFSEKAWAVVPSVKQRRYYFDAEEYMRNIPRGMLPYTPAISVTYQLDYRLKQIKSMGVENYILQHQRKAEVFRNKILATGLFSLFAERQSNALTSFKLPEYCNMRDMIAYIKEKYSWQIAPNPTGDPSYLRVSHMGDLADNDFLLLADRLVEAAHHFNKS